MKKFLVFVFAFMICFGTTMAQYGPTKFTDNVTVGVKTGVSTSMTNFYSGVSPEFGIELEKYVTPWLGFAIDANTLINNPWGYANPHTAFDVVNVNLLGKMNILNLVNYSGQRNFFEPVIFGGIGWGHRTCSDFLNRNYMVTKVGAEMNFHLDNEKAWVLRVSPACVWGPVNDGKLNAKNGGFEVMIGVAYHFKNSDGNRAYTKITPRSQNEIDHLNAAICELVRERNILTKENKGLKRMVTDLSNRKPEVRIDTVYINLNTYEYFKVGSSDIISMASIRQLASSMNKDNKYVIVGYASEEGNKEFNNKLSVRRAENVYNALIKFGFPKENLEFMGEGPTTQFSTTDRDANRVVVIEQK